MSVLVTGGAGYIGSHTCVELLCAGWDIVSLDNFSNAKPACVARVRELTGRDFPFYEADVLDAAALRRVFAENSIDAVIHFAGLKAVGESVSQPLRYYHNNVGGAVTLCRVMGEHGVKNIVFSSSATVYGEKNGSPLTENMETGGCTNPYGQSKLMIEQILRDTQLADPGWSVSILRYFNPVGAHASGRIGEDPAGEPNNLMPYITQVAVGKLPLLSVYGGDYDTVDGTGVRDFIHVSDLAAGHIQALELLQKRPGRLHVHNLGTGRGTSVLQLLRAFEAASGKTVPYRIVGRRPGDLAVCYASADKAGRELGFTARYDIRRMCEDSWRWQSLNPEGIQ